MSECALIYQDVEYTKQRKTVKIKKDREGCTLRTFMGASASSARAFLKQGRPAWNNAVQEQEQEQGQEYALYLLRQADRKLFPGCRKLLQNVWTCCVLVGRQAEYMRMCKVLREDRLRLSSAIEVLKQLTLETGKQFFEAVGAIEASDAVLKSAIDKLAFAFAVSVAGGAN